MSNFYDLFSIEDISEPKQPIKKKETSLNCSEEELVKALYSYETMFKDTLKIKPIDFKPKTYKFKSYFSTEDEDPFADLADGLDSEEPLPGDDSSGGFDDGGNEMSFDSFEDSSDSVFGGDDWGGDGDSNSETKAKALEVSRSDLLDENYNLGKQVRSAIPEKIANLNNIIDYNIDIVNKNLHKNSDKFLDDLLFIKESYEEIKKSIEEYLMIIDSKTFDDIFSDYVVFLSLIDKTNEMYQNVVKQQ